MTDEAPPPPEQPPPSRRRRGRRILLLVLAILVVAALFLVGVLPRHRAARRVVSETAELAIPNVAVVRPERSAPAQALVLPGSVQAYASAPIFARASGFVKKWYADIGAHVKQGQLLAVIEVPELEQQLQVARGQLAAAEANLRTSEATAKRFEGLAGTKAVAQQEVDTAVGNYHANQATVQANQANVRQLEKTLAYSQVRAPFDGVITQRNVDVGDLVNAGSSTNANAALFQILQSAKLRVYVSVPEAYARGVKPHMHAKLTLTAFPGRTFTGTLVRTASAIDPTTRTLLAEIEVDNPTGELFAGAYAQVSLDVPARHDVYILPVETLLFRREGLQVATVAGGRAMLKSVMPGRDFGERVEIVSGLMGDENVILNPPDSITEGEPVRIAAPVMQARKHPPR